MYPMTLSFTVASEKELALFQTLLGVKPEIRAVTATVDAKPDTVEKIVKETRAVSDALQAKPEIAPAPEPKAEAPAAQADAPARTVDDAKALTMKIVSAKGRDAAVELLKKYDVPVAAKLPADKIADFCADAEAVLAS